VIANRLKTEPIPVVRQTRPVKVRAFTTAKPGKIIPVTAFGLLEGDSCSGRLNLAIEMKETYEVLYNRMHMRATAWFVPKVAMERFQRNKTFFERSAQGEPVTDEDGAETIPFIDTFTWPASADPIHRYLGVGAKVGATMSTEYRESYNRLVNYMYRQRSKALPQREYNDDTLAAALWARNSMSDIVPTFDASMIAGETPLSVVSSNLQVGPLDAGSGWISKPSFTTFSTDANKHLYVDENASPANEILAKLSTDGVKVALANIDQARKLVEWAKLRESYEGHPDPWVIDRLMSGLPIDDQVWFEPMLLDQAMVDIQQLKRMATDGASLEDGMANGIAAASLGINVPQNPFGGTVMVVIELIPEQLYERQADPYLTITDRTKLPKYDQDVMNPMPVVEVLNREVDYDHDSPGTRFGYARRNWAWAENPTRVGGDLYLPGATEVTDKERRVIYPTDVRNPTLSAEFYIATTLGREPFVEETLDPFKVGVGGMLNVVGLTVIGEVHESEANYDAVRAAYPPLANPNGV